MEIERDNFYCIMGWMVTELHLSGTKLNVYAIIHRDSQMKQFAHFSRRYLAEFTGVSIMTIQRCLDELVSSGLIEKRVTYISGSKWCDYKTIPLKSENEKWK